MAHPVVGSCGGVNNSARPNALASFKFAESDALEMARVLSEQGGFELPRTPLIGNVAPQLYETGNPGIG